MTFGEQGTSPEAARGGEVQSDPVHGAEGLPLMAPSCWKAGSARPVSWYPLHPRWC